MKTAKDIAFVSVFTALLIGAQFIFSFISGVEIVTVLFFSFAFTFGIRKSVFLATAFSLLRCLLFGFFPNVVLLYLIFYNIFAVTVGFWGNKLRDKFNLKVHIFTITIAIILTLLFTLLDDVITPLYYGYTKSAALAYFYASFATCIPQVICSALTVGILFPPIFFALKKVK